MMKSATVLLIALTLLASVAGANDRDIQSAMSAGPASISRDATIKDWNLETLREGTNGWTCLPDRPDTPGVDPWCVTDPWMNFLEAYVNKTGAYVHRDRFCLHAHGRHSGQQ